ncbi:uncharacterized protein LOC134840727 isoform X3 [Symsagittifera roscoffensis]
MDLAAAVEFQRWCEEVELNGETRQLLKSEGYSTLDAVRKLGPSDLEVLNLDCAQMTVLENALAALNTRGSQTSHQPTPNPTLPRPTSGNSDNRNNSGVYPDLTGFDNEFSDPEPENLPPPIVDDKNEPVPEAVVQKIPETEPISIEEVTKKKKPNLMNDYLPSGGVSTSPSSLGVSFFGKMKSKDEKIKKESKDEGKGDKKGKIKLKVPWKKDKKTPAVHQPTPETENKTEELASKEPVVGPLENVTEHPLMSMPSPVVKTLKEKFLEHSSLKSNGGYPEVYKLPQVTVSRDDKAFVRHCEIAIPDFPVELVIEEKVILCVGASGAGKTTLINGLANYLLGVQWEDAYRFEIIPDKDDKTEMDSASQTQWITAYTFYIEKNMIPFKVTIIDTPGFGDTKGIAQDEELDNKIRNLFDQTTYGLDQLHAVCFTTQASATKMNAFQRYIYNRVLSIFGKDVEENIFMMVTFADAQEPKVVKVLQENSIPFRKYFKFNNSALYAGNKESSNEDEMFNHMFWKMGNSSFQSFLEFLDSQVTPVTLKLTKEVMAKREALQVYIVGLQENVKKGLVALDQIRQEMDVVTQHEVDIARNRDFTYKVKEYFTERIDKPEGRHVTNCQNCNRTCHLNCKYSNDDEKRKCSAMDSDGYCKICAPSNGGKCHWTTHYNMAYYFVFKERVIEKRSEDLFVKYKQATDKKIDAESLLAKIGDRFSNIQGEVIWQTNEIRKCLSQLGEIALKPNPLTTVDYIDQMIIAEKDSCEAGWRERVYQLESARQYAEYLQKLQDEGYDPWEERSGADVGEDTKKSRLNSVSEFLYKLKSGVWGLIGDDSDDE